ncbi:MAG: fumarylacetoacetate hydrolase family protein [Gammaproteobacteria bacterium]
MQLQPLFALLVGIAAAGDGWAGQAALEGWADVIATERQQGKLLPRVSDLQPGLDLDEAYAIQRALVTVERPHRGIGGYKAGFTNPASRAPYGLNGPVTGVLYADGARADGATIDLADFHRLMIEVEIGFVLRSPIRRPMKSLDDLLTYVREVVPVIELPDLAYDNPERLRGLDIVATNMAASAYVVGAPLRLSRPAAVNDIDVVLFRDGKPVDEGRAANAMGDQLGALLWLVNHVQAAGLPLETGHVLITGTLGKMNAGIAGHYRAEYAGSGEVAFEVIGATPATAQVK